MIDLNTAVSEDMQQIWEGGSKVSSKETPRSGGMQANELMTEDHVPTSTHDVSKRDVELP